MAWAHQLLKNYEESLHICDAGLSVEPDDAELWFRKAVAYRYLRRNIEAEACWRHILSLRRPEKFCSIDQGIYGHLTRRNLAIIAGERGDHQEAEKHWQAVLVECPDDPDAMQRLKKHTDLLESAVALHQAGNLNDCGNNLPEFANV